MSYGNTTLWFAKDKNNNIVTIDQINEDNKHDTYLCPMCGSNVIPKALKSKQITEHFAHIDASKCNSETMMHWWFKNKFLEQGDKFIVVSNKEVEYICKNVLIEQLYKVGDRIYNPDVTIVTECGKTVYFEMNYSNKKKLEDYIDIWIELKNIVVEVDIKELLSKDKVPTFKALFYNGKCFNTKKNDIYYNAIGKYKEEKFANGVSQELKMRIKKLDWFWDDVLRYKKGEVDIEHMVDLMDCIDGTERYIVGSILEKPRCIQLYKDYLSYKKQKYIHSVTGFITDINNRFHNEFRIRLEEDDEEDADIFTLVYKIEEMTRKKWRGWKYFSVRFDYIQLSNIKQDFNQDIEKINNIINKGVLLKFNKKRQIMIKKNKSTEIALCKLSQKYSMLDKYIKINCLCHGEYRDYETDIIVSFSNWSELSFNITNNDIFQIEDSNKIKKYLSELIDEKLKNGLECKCFECRNIFSLSLGEMMFYSDKDYELPKRCSPCRKKRRALKNNG